MTPTRTRALDAAIDLLATEGLRALTHARVDERAGIPRGSTSNYFRTRAALRTGVAQRILERELTPVGAAFAPGSAPELVDALAGLIELITGPGRDLTTARLILFMEASHDAELRAELSHGRGAMAALLVQALARLGANDAPTAAAAIAAASEGLILHRIARHDDSDPRPVLELLVTAALAPDRRAPTWHEE